MSTETDQSRGLIKTKKTELGKHEKGSPHDKRENFLGEWRLQIVRKNKETSFGRE